MEAIEVIIELMEPHASFFKPILRDLVPMMPSIVLSKTASFGCSQLAIEVLVSIASTCRRFPQNSFVETVFPITCIMMLDVSEDEEDDDEDISNVDIGSEALQRMAQAIGFKKALNTCFALVTQLLLKRTGAINLLL